jgi:putative glycosyltransferase (TIGR04348 family)
MNICVVTPAPPGSLKGNRVTAERWAVLLRDLGHHVEIDVEYTGQDCDLMIALHAFTSHASIRLFRDNRPSDPLVVGLTGTDLYGDIHTRPDAVESLELATRLVLLQPLGRSVLPATVRDKARVIYQSVELTPSTQPIRTNTFEVCVMGHLRPVKDPLRTALAARLLPVASRIQVVHIGGALSEELAQQARSEAARNDRYHWLGELPRSEALGVLSRCRLLSLTSESEGGANAISEAVVAGVPVISSRIDGSIGLLGEDYPGYFPVGDTRALANLLWRAETDTKFYNALGDCGARLRPLFEPARELQSWHEVLGELFPDREGVAPAEPTTTAKTPEC